MTFFGRNSLIQNTYMKYIDINHKDETQRFHEQIIELYLDSKDIIDTTKISKLQDLHFAFLPKGDSLFAYLWHSSFFRSVKLYSKHGKTPSHFFVFLSWDKYRSITIPQKNTTDKIFGKKIEIKKDLSDFLQDSLEIQLDDNILGEVWYIQFLHFARVVIPDFSITPIYIPSSFTPSKLKKTINFLNKYDEQRSDNFFVFLENLDLDSEKVKNLDLDSYSFRNLSDQKLLRKNNNKYGLNKPETVLSDQIDRFLIERKGFELLGNGNFLDIVAKIIWENLVYEIYYSYKQNSEDYFKVNGHVSIIF